MAAAKRFALGGFLKEKSIGEDSKDREAKTIGTTSDDGASEYRADATQHAVPLPVGDLPTSSDPTSVERADERLEGAVALQQMNSGDSSAPLSHVVHTSIEKKKPGPKGRGNYQKRTIGVATFLDNFVEDARRTHVRPDGTRSTVYGHFIEDLILAELHRRRDAAPSSSI